MASLKRTKNPFYPLLVLVGLSFAITACGFAVMMVRGIHAPGALEPEASGGLMPFFEEHGFTAMMFELVVLALATFGAIATDEMWSDRADAAAPPSTDIPSTDIPSTDIPATDIPVADIPAAGQDGTAAGSGHAEEP